MTVFIKQERGEVESTVCLVCKDDYKELAEECFVAGVCEDCRDTYSNEELLENSNNAQ